MFNIANLIADFFKKKSEQEKSKPTISPIQKEHWDTHYNPKVVSYTKFHARRKLQEKNKLEANIEDKRKDDVVNDHNPWLD